MTDLIENTPVLIDNSPVVLAMVLFAVGAVVGRCMAGLAVSLVDEHPFRQSFRCASCGLTPGLVPNLPVVGLLPRFRRCHGCGSSFTPVIAWTELGTGLLFAAFGYAMFSLDCQVVSEVRPFPVWHAGRLPYHLILVSLLVAATVTDLKDYIIPDAIVLPGIAIGIFGAAFSGDLQMIHLWVDWNQAQPPLTGPFIPEWIRQHLHWHGLAWSVTGLVVSAGMTWVVRIVSGRVLGQPALGFGDVTLMAMIGSFLGWQPTVFVFALAPMCGMAIAVLARIVTGRGFLPYGPYLSAAAVIVMMTWRWLWGPTRDIFGHWPSLALIAGGALVGFTTLLGLLRVYRAIPVQTTSGSQRAAGESDRS